MIHQEATVAYTFQGIIELPYQVINNPPFPLGLLGEQEEIKISKEIKMAQGEVLHHRVLSV